MKGQLRRGTKVLSRYEAGAVCLSDHRQNDLSYGQREVIADTHSRSAAKRQIRRRRSRVRALAEALRVELFRLSPEVRVTVRHIWTNKNHCPARYPVTADFIVSN